MLHQHLTPRTALPSLVGGEDEYSGVFGRSAVLERECLELLTLQTCKSTM